MLVLDLKWMIIIICSTAFATRTLMEKKQYLAILIDKTQTHSWKFSTDIDIEPLAPSQIGELHFLISNSATIEDNMLSIGLSVSDSHLELNITALGNDEGVSIWKNKLISALKCKMNIVYTRSNITVDLIHQENTIFSKTLKKVEGLDKGHISISAEYLNCAPNQIFKVSNMILIDGETSKIYESQLLVPYNLPSSNSYTSKRLVKEAGLGIDKISDGIEFLQSAIGDRSFSEQLKRVEMSSKYIVENISDIIYNQTFIENIGILNSFKKQTGSIIGDIDDYLKEIQINLRETQAMVLELRYRVRFLRKIALLISIIAICAGSVALFQFGRKNIFSIFSQREVFFTG